MHVEQLPRIIAIGLWPKLKRRQWLGGTSTRSLSDYGDAPPFRSVATATIPRTPALNDTIRATAPHGIGCHLHPDDHPTLPDQLVATLTLQAYSEVLARSDAATLADWHLAVDEPSTPAPFRYKDQGHDRLSIVRTDDPAITNRLLAVLAEITNACSLHRVQAGQPTIIPDWHQGLPGT